MSQRQRREKDKNAIYSGHVRQPLLGELAMNQREREKLCSGHLRFCLPPKGSARTPLGPIEPIYNVIYSFCNLAAKIYIWHLTFEVCGVWG
jgi:hypothetical protein